MFTYVNGAIMQREEFDSFLSELSCSIVESVFFPVFFTFRIPLVLPFVFTHTSIEPLTMVSKKAADECSGRCELCTLETLWSPMGEMLFRLFVKNVSPLYIGIRFVAITEKRYEKLVSISTERQIERWRERGGREAKEKYEKEKERK